MMKLQGGLLQWSRSSLIPSIYTPISKTQFSISACVIERNHQLTAKERRQLRNERRESKSGYSWREEVEEKLIKKPKKRYATWTEELNLDTLAESGPQWWVVRVSRLRGHETAQILARALARQFPEMEFTVYAPSVQVKRKLKNGSISVKPKPVFPGCIFIRCILNKEIHDSIREVDGVGGFIGSKVGNTKRQINKPRPVDDSDLEAIFKQAKEAQEKADSEFEEAQRAEEEASLLASQQLLASSNSDVIEPVAESKPKRAPRKATLATETKDSKAKKKKLAAGSTVRVLSGTFAEFVGNLKKLNRKTAKATVGFTLFGKETLVEIDIDELVPEIQY
ncbi:NusG N-terminal domain superfamily [Arabidopsis thaliana x Arabidopsis arenosa]|uniref:NusG N-terminal domain superfamily n=1 Tax=Arabidopsis thaliana x Arabidopsis arenosa TaxID=1240361 RepID=A0A8T2AQZ7_9BRAS|nr:NusG N-terminal domain superfamily [Arabidopsis thaliana x Arabidopsis arenosa]